MKKDWMIKESELDEDQIKVLMATLDKSCVVSGCAGSGKSVLALIKAQRIQKEKGNSYQIIVFTKALCGYMNSGRKELGLNNQFVYYWIWKNRKNCPSSDYVIVDEIQDFSKEEIQEFINSTNKHFFFFGDTAQSIYGGLKTTMKVQDVGIMMYQQGIERKEFELYRNYRLPLPTAKYVQYVGVDLPPLVESTYKSPEKGLPYVLKYASLKEQVSAIISIIKRKDLTDVAILLPDNDYVKELGELFSNMGFDYEMKYNDREDYRNNIENLNFSSSNPKLMTYHSAKGLQFEAVFLPQIEHYVDDRDSDSKALYVAMTRTYRYLYIMYSGQLPNPLSNIPANLYKTTETEEVEDI